MPFEEEAISVFAGSKGYLDDIPVGDTVRFRDELREYLRVSKPEILASIREEQKFTDETTNALVEAIEAFTQQFSPSA